MLDREKIRKRFEYLQRPNAKQRKQSFELLMEWDRLLELEGLSLPDHDFIGSSPGSGEINFEWRIPSVKELWFIISDVVPVVEYLRTDIVDGIQEESETDYLGAMEHLRWLCKDLDRQK